MVPIYFAGICQVNTGGETAALPTDQSKEEQYLFT